MAPGNIYTQGPATFSGRIKIAGQLDWHCEATIRSCFKYMLFRLDRLDEKFATLPGVMTRPSRDLINRVVHRFAAEKIELKK
jgi:hypothetical protein